MLVFYILSLGVGVLMLGLTALPRPRAPEQTQTPPAEAGPKPMGNPTGTRLWAFPLTAFGLLGVTLTLLDRTFVQTLTISLTVGIPVGLAAVWLLNRLESRS